MKKVSHTVILEIICGQHIQSIQGRVPSGRILPKKRHGIQQRALFKLKVVKAITERIKVPVSYTCTKSLIDE